MKALIFGGTGWIGQHIVSTRPTWDWTVLGSRQCNLLDASCVHDINGDFDVIVNSAGFFGGLVFNQRHAQDILYKNLQITANTWKIVQKLRPKKFVNIGSACIYPKDASGIFSESLISGTDFHPSVRYSAQAKHIQLQLMDALEIPWEYLIISNAYGPGEETSFEKSHFVGSIINKLQKDPDHVTLLGDGSSVRDFIYIKDVCEAVCRYAERSESTCRPTNISSGQGIVIKQMVEKLASMVNPGLSITWGNAEDNGVSHKVLDNTKMKTDLQYHPATSIDKGLDQTWQWFKANREHLSV